MRDFYKREKKVTLGRSPDGITEKRVSYIRDPLILLSYKYNVLCWEHFIWPIQFSEKLIDILIESKL